jgi:hypothetical protein
VTEFGDLKLMLEVPSSTSIDTIKKRHNIIQDGKTVFML